ncbi:MAG: acetate--CoA ligase family protein [Alphaproteobacteria bacterium]|nr:acetate--CoA ligase family protein [Alphaproteobacteria bacterium]
MTVADDIGRILNPASVAVIGASEDQGKFGGRAFHNLMRHRYPGAIYPINPKRDQLFGLTAYPRVGAAPTPPDMVVMAIPQPQVRAAIAESSAAGARAAVIITAKFAEAGAAGAAEQDAIVAIARDRGMRLIGPNCLGVISPAHRLVLCSSPALDVDELIEAPIGLVSQSGAMMATLFDRAWDRGIGFSHCISVGNQADLELCDFVEFMIDDPATRVIASYVEGIKSPARFLALAARARAAGKPWLMVKAGRTAGGERAAYSHTASLAGSWRAFAAIARERGVTVMDEPDAMILLAAALARFPGRVVRRVAVVTTSGGSGAVVADRLADAGLALANFGAATAQGFSASFMPGQAANPVDLGGRKEGEAAHVASTAVELVATDPATDIALFAITTAPALARITGELADAAIAAQKPYVFVMQPGKAAAASRAALLQRRALFCDTIDDAIRAIRAWRDHSTSAPPTTASRPQGLPAPVAMADGTLGEMETKALLARYGIAVNAGELARDEAEAVAAATRIGFPVAVKVVSPDLVHKTEAGAVALGLATADAARQAMTRMRQSIAAHAPRARLDGFLVQAMVAGAAELILGVQRDAQFGPFVLVGAGGVLAELLDDVALASAPTTSEQARRVLRALKLWPVLTGARGRPALDIDAVVDTIVRLSWLAHDYRDSLAELDINPLILRAAGQGCVAVDGRARFDRGPRKE